MIKIEEYIEKTKNMLNISDGGSPAFDFGDVILVRYRGEREKIEKELAPIINAKNEIGVNTPKHLAFKRIIDGDKDYCWVLEEKAKGTNCTYYTKNITVRDFLEYKRMFSELPISHYEKLLKDLCELHYMGIELAPRNIFFDENIGFSIIDFLKSSNKVLKMNSLENLLALLNTATAIDFYNWSITTDDKEHYDVYNELSNEIQRKIFLALGMISSFFTNVRRWILRSYATDTLNYFASRGIMVGDLSLDEDELNEFNRVLAKIVLKCINYILRGEKKYWEIIYNELRLELEKSGMDYAWLYHHDNRKRLVDFKNNYLDWYLNSKDDLINYLIDVFNGGLSILAKDSRNDNVKEAYDEFLKRRI